ncbi:hypothetical protein LC593_14985 [Nostoc sp. CHAB 5844]|nr:hypothetical protein [Nostoc sp. CHAB 5844]
MKAADRTANSREVYLHLPKVVLSNFNKLLIALLLCCRFGPVYIRHTECPPIILVDDLSWSLILQLLVIVFCMLTGACLDFNA